MARELWRPSPARAAATRLESFRRELSRSAGVDLPDYDALHRFSVTDPETFWRGVVRQLELPLVGPYERARSADPMPLTRWFFGARMSYAAALLYPNGVAEDDVAVVAAAEGGDDRRLTWAELRAGVASVQQALLSRGVSEGDRVVAFCANVPEALMVMLACAGLGAVYASASPDFGAVAATARFSQLEPKVLFATTGYVYGGRVRDVSAVAAQVAAAVGAEHAVTLPRPDGPEAVPDGFVSWSDATAASGDLVTADLPFDHPLYVLFSSGTTGVPKGLVHRAGGALLTHMKELALHCDVRPGDVVQYYTTCGWMMWNWQVSALALGATIAIYDGSPVHPDALTLFDFAERAGTTLFGTSARFIHGLAAEGVELKRGRALERLRSVASTGSPLSPAGFRYVYDQLGDVHLASISGGTDIVGCFMLGVPTLPVYEGEIQRPGLGVDLAAFDEEGRPVFSRPGELVCRQPLPSMPLRFVGDEGYRRYSEAYLGTFPGVWRHGDLIEFTETGGIVVHGRSDATLNPGGVRIGTAEVYRALEVVPEVVEAVAVGRKVGPEVTAGVGSDEEVWLLVVLRPGEELTADREARVRQAVREGASPRHVPAVVLQVPGLPRTRSGKSMEIAVRRLVNGQSVENEDVVDNPEVLPEIVQAVRRAESARGRALSP